MRKKVIAGNWKMNMLPNEAINFLIELRDKMISILSRRIENIFNDEYPKEVFYE